MSLQHAAGVVPATLLAAAIASACPGVQTPVEPTVTIAHETLLGAYGEREPQVASFKGIPFAAPPVGALRWQAPQATAARTGLQRAVTFAPACYQDSYLTDWYRRVGAAFGAAAAEFSDPPFSEDCLYLNVWTPARRPDAALPVMVWIHGGSNRSGWTFEPNYVGERLAARGRVVVVSIAYRLGIFGFFGHPELRDSPAPTNFGLLDQIAALRWVHEHISRFGGDPDNVTIFGESAGATDIGYLITSPLAGGLFRRAVSESGGSQMRSDRGLAEAEHVGLAVARALPGEPDLAGLRERSSAEIFQAARAALPDHDYGPVVDGRVVTLLPATYYRRHGVPFDLLIGTNANEWYMYVNGDPDAFAGTLAGLPAGARQLFEARAAQEPDVRHGHDKVMTLAEMVCPAYLMAGSAARSGRRAWVYLFTRVRPGPGGAALLAYHGAEIPYVFDTQDGWLSGDATDVQLTSAMVAYWSSFARSGDPNGADRVPWPAFDPQDPRLLALGSPTVPMSAPDAALCERVAPSIYPGWTP